MRNQGSQANGGGVCRRPGVSGQGGGWGSPANGEGGYVTDQGSQGKGAGGGLRPMAGVGM